MKTVIIYGSTTGNAEDAAKSIGNGFENSLVSDVCDFDLKELANYDLIILGSSTAGAGDLQDEWEDKIDELDNIDLSKKTVAIFGTGDQEGYPETFAGALSFIYAKVENSGAKLIGKTSTDGYEFDESDSVQGNKFVGLVIDDENQAQFTDKRIKDWILQLTDEY